MTDFNSMFPHFLHTCLDLKRAVTPFAYVLLTSGLMATVVTGHRSGSALMRTFGKTIIFVTMIVFLPQWGNALVTIVDDGVKNVLKADPSKIFDQYNAALELKKAAGANRNWWEKVMDWRAAPMEWITSAIFFYLGWFASVIMWWAYIIQSAILFMGYALSPIFIGFLAFASVQGVGRNYLLHLLGVMLWPLGWGLASLITLGMIDFMTDRSFLAPTDLLGNNGYSLQNSMGLAFLGVWIIFSTIAAPVIIQKSIETGSSAAASLLSGAFNSGRAAAGSAVNSLGSAGSASSGGAMLKAGALAAGSAAETVMDAGLGAGGGGGTGSLLGSLGRMGSSQSQPQPIKSSSRGFPKNDPTGDRTVEALLRSTRNPHSNPTEN